MGCAFESSQLSLFFLRKRRSKPEKYQNLAQDLGAVPVVGGIKMERASCSTYFKVNTLS